jgi:hypothetical protein
MPSFRERHSTKKQWAQKELDDFHKFLHSKKCKFRQIHVSRHASDANSDSRQPDNHFYDMCAILQWFEATNSKTATNLQNILESLYYLHVPGNRNSNFRLRPEEVKNYKKVLIILLSMGQECLIEIFKQAGYSDRLIHNSPVDEEMKQKLQRLISDKYDHERAKGIIKDFEDKKWLFSETKLDFGYEEEFRGPAKLPFCLIRDVTAGGTAKVTQAFIPERFVSDRLKNELGLVNTKDYGKVFKCQNHLFLSQLKLHLVLDCRRQNFHDSR